MRKGVIFANDKSDRLFMDDTPIQRAEHRVIRTQVAAQAQLAVPLQDIVSMMEVYLYSMRKR